jgi:hypothetical protein
MRFLRLALLGVSSLLAGVAACSGDVTQVTGGTTGTTGTTGSGGAGGAGSTTVTTTTSNATTGTGGAGANNGMPSDVYPAKHSKPPSVVSYNGPVLASPKIVPVFFADYDATLAGQVADFDSKVGATQYWAANVTEYGVGPATSAAAIMLTETAPPSTDDMGIQTWLAGKLNGDDPAWPAADANTLYSLHYPESTTITSGNTSSCVDFGGYHSNINLDAAHGSLAVAYAVIPSCSNFDMMTLEDATTATESHELVEAVTDPYPMTTPAYTTVDDGHFYWTRILGGGEIGDMCAQFASSYTVFPELPGYLVQRSWSNVAANAGHDPCVPALPGSVYFNTAPVLPDTITASMFGQMVSLKGVKIPVGTSKVVELDLFSEAKTSGPWTVTVKDGAAAFGGKALLDFSLDKDSGVNGEKLNLTITVNTAGKHGTETFIIDSQLGTQKTVWIGIVGSM